VDEATNRQAVVLTVPATAEHLSLLRTLVGYYAGRERFTIDQIDDLKMAVDEAGVQLLRKVVGDVVRLELLRVPAAVVVRVGAEVVEEGSVIDPESFSWTILRALTDDVDVRHEGTYTTVVLTKHHLVDAAKDSDDVAVWGKVDG
jgi:serine/threonine-protein kinase RsbW